MMTTIFTGHTLKLTDIVAIGPIMQSSKGIQGSIYRRAIYMELYLKPSLVLTHESLTQEIVYQPQVQENERWNQAFDKLKAEREALIAQWTTAEK